jgi:hypothetical protein
MYLSDLKGTHKFPVSCFAIEKKTMISNSHDWFKYKIAGPLV